VSLSTARSNYIEAILIMMHTASAYASSQIAKRIRPRQREWMQAVQKRVALTSDVLSSLKGMKILGLTEMITRSVQDTREQELHKSKLFRHMQIINITLGMFFFFSWVVESNINQSCLLRKCIKHAISRHYLHRIRNYREVLDQ
jgi:hypothetical protein